MSETDVSLFVCVLCSCIQVDKVDFEVEGGYDTQSVSPALSGLSELW